MHINQVPYGKCINKFTLQALSEEWRPQKNHFASGSKELRNVLDRGDEREGAKLPSHNVTVLFRSKDFPRTVHSRQELLVLRAHPFFSVIFLSVE